VYERILCESTKPEPFSLRSSKESFIKAKYCDRAFVRVSAVNSPIPSGIKASTPESVPVASSSVETTSVESVEFRANPKFEYFSFDSELFSFLQSSNTFPQHRTFSFANVPLSFQTWLASDLSEYSYNESALSPSSLASSASSVYSSSSSPTSASSASYALSASSTLLASSASSKTSSLSASSPSSSPTSISSASSSLSALLASSAYLTTSSLSASSPSSSPTSISSASSSSSASLASSAYLTTSALLPPKSAALNFGELSVLAIVQSLSEPSKSVSLSSVSESPVNGSKLSQAVSRNSNTSCRIRLQQIYNR